MSSSVSSPRGNLLDGNPWATLWTLCWPLVLTMVMNAAIGLLDTWIAGRLGPVSQAAVGLSMQLIMLVNAAIMATSIGCQALVARFVGAENWEDAARSAQQTLLLGLWVTSLVLVPVYMLAPSLFQAMGATPAVQAEGTGYLRLLLLGLFAMDLNILLHAVFRARGRPMAILVSNTVEAVVWISCSLALGLYAGWGLAGLATGFVAGKTAGMIVSGWLFRRSRLFAHITQPWRSDWGWFRRILNIGLPAGVQVIARNFGMLAYFAILGLLAHPTEAVAAFSISFRIESIAFFPVFALNIAAATMVGQNLGAKRPEEAAAMGWRIAGVAMVIMTGFALFFYLAADALVARFTDDPLVASYAADYLRIIALSEPFLGVAMVLNGAFQGAGEARVPMTITLVTQVLLRLPLAWGLAVPLGLGTTGAWWAMTASMWLQGAIVVWLFQRGKWKEREV